MVQEKTFWEHLDELRSVIVRIVLSLVVLSVVLFFFKDALFGVALAPSSPDFTLYKLISRIAPLESVEEFAPQLINTELTGQFMIHMQVAFYGAVIVAAPYILWQLFGYVSPALYDNERKMVRGVLVAGTALFYAGALLSYFLIFPLSFRFLILYQVDEQVSNMIQLSSYIDTLLVLTLLMGVLFELPLVAIMLGRYGFVTSEMMSSYRRHALLAILIISAIITPTTDVFTLMIVSLPIYLLYEASILSLRMMKK